MQYGVFILVNNKWRLHCMYINLGCANMEADYLNKNGIVASVFKKK